MTKLIEVPLIFIDPCSVISGCHSKTDGYVWQELSDKIAGIKHRQLDFKRWKTPGENKSGKYQLKSGLSKIRAV